MTLLSVDVDGSVTAGAAGTTTGCSGRSVIWTGRGSTPDWANGANWSTGSAPAAADAAFVAPGSGPTTAVVTTAVQVCALVVGAFPSTTGGTAGATGAASGSAASITTQLQLAGSGASVTVATTVDDFGTIGLAPGSRLAAATVTVETDAGLVGVGAITGNVVDGGTIEALSPTPGTGPFVLAVNGDFTQGQTGAVVAPIQGTVASGQFGALHVTGRASLAAALDTPGPASGQPGFTPVAGDAYPLVTAGSLSGTFASLTDNRYPAGSSTPSFTYSPSYTATGVIDVVHAAGSTQPPATTVALAAMPTNVNPGQSLAVSWSNLQTSGNDWISLHPVGAPNSSYVSWHGISAGSGTVTFTAPAAAGSYELRLFRNGTQVATSNPVTVASVVVVAGVTAGLLQPDQTVTAGVPMSATWNGLIPSGNDWISLHPAGAPDSTVLAWDRIAGAQGSASFTAPTTPGSYEFRLFSNGVKVATSTAFTVVSAPAGDEGTDSIVVAQEPDGSYGTSAPSVADGVTEESVKVILIKGSAPVGGAEVKLFDDSPTAKVRPDTGAGSGKVYTDTSGVAKFIVTDKVLETVTYTARDVSNQVTVGRTAQVVFGCDEASSSTIEATGTPLADGHQSARVTVTLNCITDPLTGRSMPLRNHAVRLDPVFASPAVITPVSRGDAQGDGVTDKNGRVVFTVTDTTPEQVVLEPTDVTAASVLQDDAVSVNFASYGSPYVALGDSYSAGFGDGDYGWDSTARGCERSHNAYPQLLDTSQPLGAMAFRACSGAVTQDLFASHRVLGRPEPAQICGAHDAEACPKGTTPWLGPATQVVTLTIGGNDAGFSDVLSKCVHGRVEVVWTWHDVGGGRCLDDPGLKTSVDRRIAALGGSGTAKNPDNGPIHPIAQVLADIHAAAPNARVFVGLYPGLFGQFEDNCTVGSLHILHGPFNVSDALAVVSRKYADQINALGTELDGVILNAVVAAGPWAVPVDAPSAFAGHGFCDAGANWFIPLKATVDYNHQNSFGTNDGAFHPSPDGQLYGFKAAFAAAGA